MSELNKKAWAVVSERGIEGSGLTYKEAVRLSRTLEADRIHGLFVVTDAAAQREADQITLRNGLSRKR